MENELATTENEQEKISYQGFKFTGAFLLLVGLVIGIIIYVDFVHRDNIHLGFYFDTEDNLMDLASALLGTTGLFWSLAGSLLFFYSIMQTRQEMNLQIKEMKQTNESLIGQKLQTTFFNLLDNHTRLINNIKFNGVRGQDGLETFSNELFDGYKEYKRQYDKRSFRNYSVMNRHPFNALQDNRSAVDSYISNFSTIIRFIEEKLDDKTFYYQLVLNYLSLSERFLLGSYVNNYRNPNQEFIEKHCSHFLYFYYSKYPEFRYERLEHFPRIFIRSHLNEKTESGYDPQYLNGLFKFYVSLDNSLYNEFIELIECEISVLSGFDDTLIIYKNKPQIEELEYIIEFNDEFFNCFEKLPPGDFYLQTKFQFKTTNDIFNVHYVNLFQKNIDFSEIVIKIEAPSKT